MPWLALLGLALGVALAEGLARLLAPGWKPSRAERATFWRHDSLLGWSHRPGQRGVFAGRGFSVQVAINSRGLRDREHELPRKPSGPLRVLLLGDSYGWGFGVDQDSTLASRLDRPETGLEVVNGSVSGYGTGQELLWYRTQGARYRPDLVLLLVAGSDVDDNRGPSAYWYPRPHLALEGDSLLLQGVPVPTLTFPRRVKIWLLGRTYLGVGLRGAWWRLRGALLDAVERRRHAPDDAGGPGVAAEDSTHYRVTRALVRSLPTETRARGARLAIALTPLEPPLATWWKATAQAERVPILDLGPSVTRDPVARLEHDEHWNALGHARAAEALRPFLDSLLAAPS